MATPDLTALREAASRLVSNWHYNYGHPKTTFAKKSERLVSDVDCLADAYLALTDPAPLTVERLVEIGGVREGETIHWNDFEILTLFLESTTWRWWYRGSRQHHPPRTVGELTQLLMRMEK